MKSIYFLLPFIFFTGIYEFSLPAAQGGTINLSDYRGKKMLIVNTASNSGLAIQYAKLEELYQKYKDSLVIIAIPSNSFGNEQDDDSTIYEHVTAAYDITYPLAGKTEVAGDSTHELYQWLSLRALNNVTDIQMQSDFQKILIDGSGKITGIFSSAVDPMSKEMQDAITGNE